METAYFISDVHLHFTVDETERLRRAALYELLDRIRQEGATLFILGDWFDFYFEYQQVISTGYFDVFCKLNELRESGISINFVVGNHDYWLGDFLKKTLGIKIYLNPVQIEFDGKQWYLIHGDGLAKKDVGYRILRGFLRHPLLVTLFRWLHPDVGHWLAKFVSYQSRTLNADETAKLEARVQENLVLARKKFETDIHFFVTGHVHWPRIETLGGKTFLTLGDWLDHFSYGYYNGANLLLKQWPVKSLPQRELP